MATVFGKGLRARRKATNEDEVTPIADEANLWWTRRDFVQEPVVRNRAGSAAKPHAPSAEAPRPTAEPGSFADQFSTDSLFGRREEAPHTPADTAPPTASPEPPESTTTAKPSSNTTRARVAINHPLFPALLHLGLDTNATWSDVQHAYRAKAKLAHPDRTGDDGVIMAELNQAYTALRDGRRYGFFDD